MTPWAPPQMIFPEPMSIIYKHELPLGHDAVRRWQQASRLWCSQCQLPSKAPLGPWPATALLLPEELWPKVNLGAWAFPGRVSDSQPSRDPTATPVTQRSPASRIWYLLSRGGAEVTVYKPGRVLIKNPTRGIPWWSRLHSFTAEFDPLAEELGSHKPQGHKREKCP